MNKLIPIICEGEKPTIGGRTLHPALDMETLYLKRFPYMSIYSASVRKGQLDISVRKYRGPPKRLPYRRYFRAELS